MRWGSCSTGRGGPRAGVVLSDLFLLFAGQTWLLSDLASRRFPFYREEAEPNDFVIPRSFEVY